MSESAITNSTTAQSSAGPVDLDVLRATVAQAAQSRFYRDSLGGAQIDSIEDFRKLPLTTRADLETAGVDGTRAVPLEEICHYGMTSGTTGQPNSTWLTPRDLERNASAIRERHPDIFAPGKIFLNRFPFMAAPAHLMQLISQQGGGVSIPAGNINWDVPYAKALELGISTGASVLAGLPLEPIVLAGIARARGIDPARDTKFDTFFLGGAPLPPVLARRIERDWNARVVELYGSTETMLLGTGCAERSLHIETDLVYCEVLAIDSDEPAAIGEEGRLIVTTLGLEGSPLVRLDTGDRVRLLEPCPCGDPRPRIIVLGRDKDVCEFHGKRLHSYELIEAGAMAADEVGSAVFFVIVLPDRILFRIESETESGDPEGVLRAQLGDLPIEVERTPTHMVLDVEHLSRSPSVYKPLMLTDWRGEQTGRKLISVTHSMMEWPTLSGGEAWRWLKRLVLGKLRSRALSKSLQK